MGHAYYYALNAALCSAVDNLANCRNQSVGTFKRKALVARIARVQKLFEIFGASQTLQNTHP